MQVSELSTARAAANSAKAPQDASATSAGDFHTFLTLLTAQMRNQDPLKPMDSTEFVAQLASFSSVEQQIETNSKLSELLGVYSNSPTESLTDWLGKEVRHEGAASFSGEPINIDVTVNPAADSARLVVRDENAGIVFIQPIDPRATSAVWSGGETSGGTAPEGRYRFEVESYSNGDLIDARAGSVFDLVAEVRADQGDTILMFEGGDSLRAELVTTVRIPSSSATP